MYSNILSIEEKSQRVEVEHVQEKIPNFYEKYSDNRSHTKFNNEGRSLQQDKYSDNRSYQQELSNEDRNYQQEKYKDSRNLLENKYKDPVKYQQEKYKEQHLENNYRKQEKENYGKRFVQQEFESEVESDDEIITKIKHKIIFQDLRFNYNANLYNSFNQKVSNLKSLYEEKMSSLEKKHGLLQKLS